MIIVALSHCIVHEVLLTQWLIGNSKHRIIKVILSKHHRLKGLFKSMVGPQKHILTYLPNGGEFNGDVHLPWVNRTRKNHLKERKATQEAPIFQLFHRVFPLRYRLLDLSHDQGHNQNHFLRTSGARKGFFPAKNPSNASLMFLGPICLVREVSICER